VLTILDILQFIAVRGTPVNAQYQGLWRRAPADRTCHLRSVQPRPRSLYGPSSLPQPFLTPLSVVLRRHFRISYQINDQMTNDKKKSIFFLLPCASTNSGLVFVRNISIVFFQRVPKSTPPPTSGPVRCFQHLLRLRGVKEGPGVQILCAAVASEAHLQEKKNAGGNGHRFQLRILSVAYCPTARPSFSHLD